MELILIAVAFLILINEIRLRAIASYKIGYYETKLKNRNVDISHVENIGLFEILKQ